MSAGLRKVMIHPRQRESVMEGSLSDPESQRRDSDRISRRNSSAQGSRGQTHGSSSVSRVLRRGLRNRGNGTTAKNAPGFAESVYSSALVSNPKQSRLISRGRGSHPNTVMVGRVLQHRWYLWLWFHLIDTPWVWLLSYYLATFIGWHLIFAVLFYFSNGVIDTANESGDRKNISFWDCIYFTNQSMDTIGYGGLQPRSHLTNWIVFFASWTSNLYWVIITGLSLAKFQKPSRLKRTIVFSEVACVNTQTAKRFERHVAFSAENAYEQGRYAHGLRRRTKSGRVLGGSGASLTPYFNDVNALYAPSSVPRSIPTTPSNFPNAMVNNGGIGGSTSTNSITGNQRLLSDSVPFQDGACLVFRFAHIRPCSRLCETSFNLLLFERATLGSEDTSSAVRWHTGPIGSDSGAIPTHTDTNNTSHTSMTTGIDGRHAGSAIPPQSSGVDSDTSGAGAARVGSQRIHGGAEADAEFETDDDEEEEQQQYVDDYSDDEDSSDEEWFNGFEDFRICEMAFELNEQYDRVRSMSMSIPLLTLPWTVTHCIDKYSPLYGLSVDDMRARKMEVIAVLDGIDESSSENFQVWYSYVASELQVNCEFVPMCRSRMVNAKSVYYRDWYARVDDVAHVPPNHANAQDFLFVDLDRISVTRPVRQVRSLHRRSKKQRRRRNKNSIKGITRLSESPSVRQGLL